MLIYLYYLYSSSPDITKAQEDEMMAEAGGKKKTKGNYKELSRAESGDSTASISGKAAADARKSSSQKVLNAPPSRTTFDCDISMTGTQHQGPRRDLLAQDSVCWRRLPRVLRRAGEGPAGLLQEGGGLCEYGESHQREAREFERVYD
jgi:hypothetical protein